MNYVPGILPGLCLNSLIPTLTAAINPTVRWVTWRHKVTQLVLEDRGSTPQTSHWTLRPMASSHQVTSEMEPWQQGQIWLLGDTETPGDIKKRSRVLFQGKGAFSVEGEMGWEDTHENRPSWFLGALSPLAGVHPSGCVPGSRLCGGVWSSQPPWRAGVPLGCSWHSGDDCPARSEPPCSRCQAEWIQCVLIMNEWLIATALENYDVTSLTMPRSRVQMMPECIIGMLASVTKCIINRLPNAAYPHLPGMLL